MISHRHDSQSIWKSSLHGERNHGKELLQPFHLLHGILSLDDALLLVVTDVRITPCSFLNFHRGTVLQLIKFKQKVQQALLSPNGQYIAVADSWKRCKSVACTAPWHEEFRPLVLHRMYTEQLDNVSCIAWSMDSSVVMVGVETRQTVG